MYQELTPVQGDCTNLSMTQQRSFDSEDGFQVQGFHSYPYGADHSLPAPPYSSAPPSVFSGQQMNTSQNSMATSYHDNQAVAHHDLPSIVNRPDLQWITTSSSDIKTQSPLSCSSPRPMPPMYPSQASSPNRNLHSQESLENNSSSTATVARHHHGYPSGSIHEPPPLQRIKKPTSSTQKPKGTPGRKRKFQDHELTPAEAAKRHIRRERNKVAAAKCRNRRRELTDRLQGETDQLEDHQSMLHQEIIALQQEKDHLEFILAAHSPNCKAGFVSTDSTIISREEAGTLEGVGVNLIPPPEVMEDMIGGVTTDTSLYYVQPRHANIQMPDITISHNVTRANNVAYELSNDTMPSGPTDLSSRVQPFSRTSRSISNRMPTVDLENLENLGEASLDTPVCTLATPSNNSGVFTFPSTPGVSNTSSECSFSFSGTSAAGQELNRTTPRPLSTTTVTAATSLGANVYNRVGSKLQSCSAAHRRSSSSESHHSPDSVKSPKLLAL